MQPPDVAVGDRVRVVGRDASALAGILGSATGTIASAPRGADWVRVTADGQDGITTTFARSNVARIG